jgi:hypothetical protein
MIRVLQRSFRMPASGYGVLFFVMFGSSAMGLRREFVLLGGFPVFLVHGISSCGSVGNSRLMCTRRANLFEIGNASLKGHCRGLLMPV